MILAQKKVPSWITRAIHNKRLRPMVDTLHQNQETPAMLIARVCDITCGLLLTSAGIALPLVAQTHGQWTPGELLAAVSLIAGGIAFAARFVWKLSLQKANLGHKLKEQDKMLEEILTKLKKMETPAHRCDICGHYHKPHTEEEEA